MRPQFLSLAAALLLCVAPTSANGNDVETSGAELPCAFVYRLFSAQTPIADGVVRVKVKSDDDRVKPKDIKMVLVVKDQVTELTVAEDGTVLIPLSRRLLEAKATIKSNQPKGTMELLGPAPKIGKVELVEGRIPYRKLMDGAHKRQQIAEEFAGKGLLGREVSVEVSVLLRSRDGRRFVAAVAWQRKSKRMESDGAGTLVLPYDEEAWRSKATVLFDPKDIEFVVDM
jgi:hypothetical protein